MSDEVDLEATCTIIGTTSKLGTSSAHARASDTYPSVSGGYTRTPPLRRLETAWHGVRRAGLVDAATSTHDGHLPRNPERAEVMS